MMALRLEAALALPMCWSVHVLDWAVVCTMCLGKFFCESLFGLSIVVTGWRWGVCFALGNMELAALFPARLLWKARGGAEGEWWRCRILLLLGR